jgi:hypothetical protein
MKEQQAYENRTKIIRVVGSLLEMTPDYALYPQIFGRDFVEHPTFTAKDIILVLTTGNSVICPL